MKTINLYQDLPDLLVKEVIENAYEIGLGAEYFGNYELNAKVFNSKILIEGYMDKRVRDLNELQQNALYGLCSSSNDVVQSILNIELSDIGKFDNDENSTKASSNTEHCARVYRKCMALHKNHRICKIQEMACRDRGTRKEPKIIVVLYDDIDAGGNRYSTDSGHESDLRNPKYTGANWNDRAKSIFVADGWNAGLHEHVAFNSKRPGKHINLKGGFYDLKDLNPNFEGILSSLAVTKV